MKSPLISIQDFASNHSLAVNWLNSEIIRLSRCLLVIALLAAGVSAQVIIDFAATPITGSQPLVVSFEATVTGGTPSAYFWNFGDGNFGASQNPSHVYLAQQTTSYTVTLVVFTDNGMGNEIKTDFITVVPGVVPVGFFETAVSGTNPLSVSFTGFSNVFPVDSWQWDFGDGQTSSLQSPTHVFTAATLTSFTVSLTIEFGGQFETITKTDLVTVTPAIFTVDFSESIVSGANPLSVSFSDLTDISPITSRLWEFGDGQTSTQPNPTHVYSVATTTSFTVSLTIELGAQIQSLTKTNLIVVDPAALVVDFDVDNSNGDPGLIVQFQNLSSGMNVETWNWDFGDGNISTQQNPTNTYIFPGDYDVTLTAFIGVQEATLSKQSFITVNQVPQPAADFLVSAPTGNHPLTVDFINLSTGSLVTGYLWDFGDGTTSAQTDPTHTYFVTEETSFDVSLTIFTVLGNDILTVADQITVFFPFASHTVGATASAARVLKTADMNGDGALDVIVGTDGDDSVSWYENFNALGSFGPSQPIATNTPNPISIDIADFDGDGDKDVIVADDDDRSLTWYANEDSLGSFGQPQSVVEFPSGFTGFVTAGDLDGDGDEDFIGRDGWYENSDGLGAFEFASGFTPGGDIVEIADIDLDGDLDVFLVWEYVLKGNNRDVIWHYNTDGEGSFVQDGTVQIFFFLFPDVTTLNSADLDLDGDIDLTVALGSSVRAYENRVLTDGDFLFLFSGQASGTIGSISLADITGDGLPDVLGTLAQEDSVIWFENMIDMDMFSPEQFISTTAFGASSVATGDLDGDGDQDTIALITTQNSIQWYENPLASPDWPYLAPGLPGDMGNPILSGAGELTAGENVNIKLTNALTGMPAVLVVGFDRVDIPLFGGTLIPFPDFRLKGLFPDANGEIVWDLSWPPGLATNTSLYFQYFVADPSTPQGLSASNGIRGSTE